MHLAKFSSLTLNLFNSSSMYSRMLFTPVFFSTISFWSFMIITSPFIRASTRRHRGPPWHPMILNRPRGVSLLPSPPLLFPSAVAESSQNAFFLSLNNVLNTCSERMHKSKCFSEISRACNLYALFFCFLLLLLLLFFSYFFFCLDAFASFIKASFRSSLIVMIPSSSSSSSCRLKDNIFEEVDAAGAFQSLFIHRTCSSFSTSAIAA
mmetsp:Transcript_2771/g.8536  ORF Transcript_2771/g.8536 Transcript_2771/m.8536 type:complete len:208 (+) Transcript_2771:4405-5028(+)